MTRTHGTPAATLCCFNDNFENHVGLSVTGGWDPHVGSSTSFGRSSSPPPLCVSPLDDAPPSSVDATTTTTTRIRVSWLSGLGFRVRVAMELYLSLALEGGRVGRPAVG
jgi:hypothetical protein